MSRSGSNRTKSSERSHDNKSSQKRKDKKGMKTRNKETKEPRNRETKKEEEENENKIWKKDDEKWNSENERKWLISIFQHIMTLFQSHFVAARNRQIRAANLVVIFYFSHWFTDAALIQFLNNESPWVWTISIITIICFVVVAIVVVVVMGAFNSLAGW